MHPALLKLLWLRLLAYFRRFATRGSVVKRIIGGVFAVFLAFSWIGPALIASFVRPREHVDPERVLVFAPIVLALFVTLRLVLAAGSAALAFSPAEMDFLFPGPFTRRQLLVYKLLGGIAGAALLSIVFTAQVRNFSGSWLSGYLALVLSFLLMQLLGVAAALTRQRLGQSVFGRLALVLAGVVVLALATAAWPFIRDSLQSASGPPQLGIIVTSIAERVRESPFSRAVLAPFEVFARVLVAPLGAALLAWGAAAAGILSVLLAFVFRLDTAYAEAAVTASAKLAERVEVAKGRALGLSVRATFTLPPFPYAGGAGPIVWRQTLAALRHLKVILFFVLIVGAVSAFMISMNQESDLPVRVMLIPMLLPLYLVFMNALRFDFRSDIERIDMLKTLPARPGMIALGQIVVPCVIMVTIVGAAVSAIHVLSEGGLGSGRTLAWVLLALTPAAVLLCSLENIVFLVMPTRQMAGSAGDMNTMIRFIGVRLLKLVILVPCAGAVAGAAAATWTFTRSAGGAYAAGWICLAALGGASIWATALAFKRFDPSRDMPA